ncbi:DUF11 domain-containing protein [Solilutibacter silvestris]|uniref:DUF11 domain-containing protein n=1 Tax=Solilutibacter silvestris TaxID=1645665 RepID=UPI0013FDC6C4|nr:DUF11 domain-containing protein [Lysobacter silvestris]
MASRLYQNVCLIQGESFNWQFSHRGRNKDAPTPGAYDVATFEVGASTPIATVSTDNTGGTAPPIAGAGEGPISANTVATWANYSGTYAYSGATGSTLIGFRAVSTASGDPALGNFLDNIQIKLAPFVEFVQSSSSGLEAAGNNLPQIRVNGWVPSSMTITVLITGGTAKGPGAAAGIPADFSTPGNSSTLTITVPAGTYDGTSAGSIFTVPVTIIDNIIPQPNRTIQFQVQASAASPKAYLLSSSNTCGAAAQATSTYTIIDDDAGVAVTKNVTSKTPVAGNPSQFDIVYTVTVKNTSALVAASYSLSDTPQFDSDVSIVSASFTKNGGASTTLSGATPWALQGQWGSLAGGATDSYLVTIRGQVARSGSTANDACTTPGSSGNGLQNSVSATYKATVGPNPTVSGDACSNTPTPAWVELKKTLNGRTVAGDQAQVRIYAGGIPSTSATTSGATDPTAATTGATVLASGTAVELRETIRRSGADTAPSAGYATSMSCSNATAGSTTVLPSGSGSASGTEQAWSGIALAAGDDITCTITNTPNQVDLSITKSNGTTTVVSGTTTTYTIVVSNAGPAAVTGATVKDTPVSGLTCPPANVVTCTGTGCPAGPITTSNLTTGSGVTMGTMAAATSATFTVTCNVQ